MKSTKAMKKTTSNAMKKSTKKSTTKSTKTMKKAMKTAKAMKAAKTMKKAKRVSHIAKGKRARIAVFKGNKVKTATGLKKSDLIKSKSGKIVSKKQSARGKKMFHSNGIARFSKAVVSARKALKIKGFVPVGGKTPEGQALLKKARSLYKK